MNFGTAESLSDRATPSGKRTMHAEQSVARAQKTMEMRDSMSLLQKSTCRRGSKLGWAWGVTNKGRPYMCCDLEPSSVMKASHGKAWDHDPQTWAHNFAAHMLSGWMHKVHGCLTDSRRKYIGTESDSSIMHITLTRVVQTVEIECVTHSSSWETRINAPLTSIYMDINTIG